MDYAMFALRGSLQRDPTSVQRTNNFDNLKRTWRRYSSYIYMQSAAIAEKIKKLKEEIKAIEQANREYRKIKHPAIRLKKFTKIAASGC